jgi:hypothetical protein
MLALISSLAASQVSVLTVVALFLAALFLLLLGALFSSARRVRYVDRPLAG